MEGIEARKIVGFQKREFLLGAATRFGGGSNGRGRRFYPPKEGVAFIDRKGSLATQIDVTPSSHPHFYSERPPSNATTGWRT